MDSFPALAEGGDFRLLRLPTSLEYNCGDRKKNQAAHGELVEAIAAGNTMLIPLSFDIAQDERDFVMSSRGRVGNCDLGFNRVFEAVFFY